MVESSQAVIPTGKYQFESNSQLQASQSHLRRAVIPTGKYQFESNSQPWACWAIRAWSCDSYRKVPIWKQFTTSAWLITMIVLLWFLQESTNLKAIHNQSSGSSSIQRLWFLQESTNLKAIHNFFSSASSDHSAVIPTGKYQFESNSQLPLKMEFKNKSCDSYRKVPIWKQFTTLRLLEKLKTSCDSYRKVPIWKQFTTWTRKRENFNRLWFLQESTNLKAIHNPRITNPRIWMLWFLQESTNLKAIHNSWQNINHDFLAVIPTGKYQFESNSQQAITSERMRKAVIPTGKYQFESNSQQ